LGKHSKEEQEGNDAIISTLLDESCSVKQLNCATRANKDWPSGKAHEVMMQLVKEYEPDHTMA
jgi:hypothetical protein